MNLKFLINMDTQYTFKTFFSNVHQRNGFLMILENYMFVISGINSFFTHRYKIPGIL